MKLWTANKETGTRIEPVASVEEGLKLIAEYEEQDKAEGTYQDGFYDVVDEDYCSVSVMDEKINNLKELRKELGWSQAELSNQLNIPRRTIEDWERGVRTPSEWSLDLIIEKLERIKGDGNMNEFKSNYEKLLANLDKLNTSDLEDFNNWCDYDDEEKEIYKAEFESKFANLVKKYNL